MPNFFKKQKRPDAEKNFFQNYADHLNYLESELDINWKKYKQLSHTDAQIDFIEKTILNRLKLFERLRDSHDYMDEVFGATSIPLLGVSLSIVAVIRAVWEGVQELAIQTGISKKERGASSSHGSKAINWLIIAGVSFITSALLFLKSAISLITRPIVTAAQGFAKQDTKRFYTDDSIITSEFGEETEDALEELRQSFGF